MQKNFLNFVVSFFCSINIFDVGKNESFFDGWDFVEYLKFFFFLFEIEDIEYWMWVMFIDVIKK